MYEWECPNCHTSDDICVPVICNVYINKNGYIKEFESEPIMLGDNVLEYMDPEKDDKFVTCYNCGYYNLPKKFTKKD